MPAFRNDTFLKRSVRLGLLRHLLQPLAGSRIALAAAAFLLAGCSYSEVLMQDAMNYNRAYEDYSNKQLLLNAVRASHHYPMKFTDFKQIQGDLTVRAGADFEIPFSKPMATANTAMPTLSITKNPSFDMDIQSRNADFIKGVLSPIEPKTLEYFITQGWNARHTLLLFGERIEFKERYKKEVHKNPDAAREKICASYPDDSQLCYCQEDENNDGNGYCTHVFKNNPNTTSLPKPNAEDQISSNNIDLCNTNNEELSSQICGFLKAVSLVKDYSVVASKKVEFGPPVPRTKIGTRMMEQIIAAKSVDLSLGCPAEKKQEGNKDLKTSKREFGECPLTKGDVQFYSDEKKVMLSFTKGETVKDLYSKDRQQESPEADSIEAELFLRAPQGILFYLGELISTQRDHDASVCVDRNGSAFLINTRCDLARKSEDAKGTIELAAPDTGSLKDIFRVVRTPVPLPSSHVMTRFDGSFYQIPREDSGMSLTTLGIVDYLIGLHQGKSDRPLTSRVKVVGQ